MTASNPVHAKGHALKTARQQRERRLRHRLQAHPACMAAFSPASTAAPATPPAIGAKGAVSAPATTPGRHHETLPEAPETPPLAHRPAGGDRLTALLSGQGAELDAEESRLLRESWGGLLILRSSDFSWEYGLGQ